MALLEVTGLNVAYASQGAERIWAVRDVDLSFEQGEFVGVVGESGCGKSTLGYALARLLRPPARTESGSIVFDGVDISTLDHEALRQHRRNGFALVLQSGMNALNPVRDVHHHFADVLRAHAAPHERWNRASIRERAAELLEGVGLDAGVIGRFPHELSGGMRQRVSIAIALSLEPKLVIFDEPTTALDVIVQRSVMSTIKNLQKGRGFTAILITHDLGDVLDSADRALVMYAGRIVEDSPTVELTRGEHHPYTEALLRCFADPRADEVMLADIPGAPPDLSLAIPGCSFAPRCSVAVPSCSTTRPVLAPLGGGWVSCQVRTGLVEGGSRG
jgi:oligopeptide/dipeptide ABC transporter ATP-binding protein